MVGAGRVALSKHVPGAIYLPFKTDHTAFRCELYAATVDAERCRAGAASVFGAATVALLVGEDTDIARVAL